MVQQGRALDAVRAFDALLAAASPEAPLSERAPLLLERAQAHLALQLFRRCLADCNAVLAESPMLPEAVRLKAVALFAMKKYAHIETLLLRFLGRAQCDQGSELTGALRQLLERAQSLLEIPAKSRGSSDGEGGGAAAAAAGGAASASTSRARLLSVDTKIMLVKVGFATQKTTPAGGFDVAIAPDKMANLEAATAGMDHPSGDFDRDVKVVLSYMLVNNAHYDEAIPLLNTILEGPGRGPGQHQSQSQSQQPVVVDAKCFAALLSRGSARAMKGGGHADAAGGAAVSAPQAIELMEGAVADFSKATEVNPQSAVAFQKLGQVRACTCISMCTWVRACVRACVLRACVRHMRGGWVGGWAIDAVCGNGGVFFFPVVRSRAGWKQQQVLMALGRDRKALAAYDAAVKLGPAGHLTTRKGGATENQRRVAQEMHTECMQARGILHKRLGDFEAAIGDLQGPVLDRVGGGAGPTPAASE